MDRVSFLFVDHCDLTELLDQINHALLDRDSCKLLCPGVIDYETDDRRLQFLLIKFSMANYDLLASEMCLTLVYYDRWLDYMMLDGMIHSSEKRLVEILQENAKAEISVYKDHLNVSYGYWNIGKDGIPEELAGKIIQAAENLVNLIGLLDEGHPESSSINGAAH